MKAVVSGGPGVGKTTLLQTVGIPTTMFEPASFTTALASTSTLVIPEFAEAVIREGNYLPGVDHLAFQKEVARRQVAAEQQLSHYPGVLFLDRGLHDAVAYRLIHGWPLVDMHHWMMQQARYDVAFVLEPLETFENNGIRYEDLEFANDLTGVLKWVYDKAGVPVLSVPNTTMAERRRFILETVNSPHRAPNVPRIMREHERLAL